ncbi:hypothetical protein B0G73_13739 [Paraburkholderia sp. BL25I1N1]|nr:hypothetical protein B0G73_13739 [Paraburkholderia sp. BL25I1N1]
MSLRDVKQVYADRESVMPNKTELTHDNTIDVHRQFPQRCLKIEI